MRQIKFRGRNSLNGQWVHGDSIKHTDNCVDLGGGLGSAIADIVYIGSKIPNARKVGAMKWVPVDPETQGQYTGLLDRNGKEIYEGDILCCEGDPDFFPETIEFDEGCFMAKDDYISVPISTIDTRCRVIIGNIHDNPDLLNGK